MNSKTTKATSEQMYEFRKILRKLSQYKGTGTELISVYIGAGSPLHDTTNKLREEASQASNIKSKSTKTNVMAALEKIIHHLKIYRSTPEKGIAVFCGNISDNPAKTDVELFTVDPPEPLHVSVYRCDSKFFLEPFERMVETRDSYGLLVLDGREATLAIMKGTQLNIVKRLNSTAHQKIRKGGQCLSPETLIHKNDGDIIEIKELLVNEKIKGLNTSKHRIEDFYCSDAYKTKSRRFHRIRTNAPTLEIEATPYHRFLVISEYGIKEKYGKDLVSGDRLIAVRKIKHKGKKIPLGFSAERIVELDKTEYEKLRETRKKLGLRQKDIAKKLGITQMAVCRMERGEIPLSKEKILQLYSTYNLKFNKKFLKPKYRLPKYLDYEFAYFLGVLCGDGTLDGNRLIIYEGKKEMVEKYCKMIKKIFGMEPTVRIVDKTGQKGSFAKKKYYEIRLYNLQITNAISSLFSEVLANSSKRNIPKQILLSENEVAAGFLKGFFDAEGYLHGKRVDVAGVSKKLIQKVQLLLLRFGILGAFSKKAVKGNSQWYVSISDLESVRNFKRHIGFSREDKTKRLKEICSRNVKAEVTNQMPIDGREVYRLINSVGLKTSDFHAASCFFRNVKPLGRDAFKRNVLPVLKGKKQIYHMLKDVADGDVVIARVAKNEKVEEEGEFIDLTVPQSANFVANGLIVHNSARRYERLIEESIEKYYKRVGLAMDEHFLNRTKSVIVGGPGPTKDFFLKAKPFNYQIKILGPVDTGYTDEYGLREVIAKSENLLAEQESIKEKIIVERFIKEVVHDGLATYGEKQVRGAIEINQAEKVLLSEGLDYKRISYKCNSCGNEEHKITREEPEETIECPKCNSKMRIVEDEPLLDDLVDLARSKNIEVEVISTNTTEGMQFLQGFAGIGAFLRYKK